MCGCVPPAQVSYSYPQTFHENLTAMDVQQPTPLDNPEAFRQEDAEAWMRKALRLPSNFGCSDKRIGDTWALGPVILTRDSNILEQSNSAAIRRRLESDPSLEDDWCITSAHHWAVGWVDHLSFRVAEPNGEPSRAARVIKGLMDSLDEYPCLDDDDYAERVYEAAWASVEQHWDCSKLRDDLPESWVGDMMDWLEANECRALADGPEGPGPSGPAFEAAARALGFWDTSVEDDA